MAKLINTTIQEFPLPDTLPTERQVIADIISSPDTLVSAEKMISPDMFSDEKCRKAYEALRGMAKDGMVIDLPSAYGRIDRELIQKGIIPLLSHVGGVLTTTQHLNTLKELDIKRKCYFKAVQLLSSASDSNSSALSLIEETGALVDSLRKEIEADKGTQHISHVVSEVGENIESLQRDRESGKMLRIPTGFPTLNYLFYGGFNKGNLVVLAARPSVGKTAVMIQMAKAAANSGKAANIFSLEMTNAELVQRFLASESDEMNPWGMARGEVEWSVFERVAGRLSSKPIYLNDSARTVDEISQRIKVGSMSGKCDIAFIDYLGLIKMRVKGGNLSQAIAEVTKDLKALAKSCGIPVVLLCQLNRASASEKRAPEMYDLRDSGGIEQDADIVLMLEKASDEEDSREVNIWVRKNRQGKAGNISVAIVGNDTFTSFREAGEPPMPPPPLPPADPVEAILAEVQKTRDYVSDFDNDYNIFQ